MSAPAPGITRPPRLGLGQRLALTLVWTYRATLKPLLPAACRFEPSCSSYALEAIRVHGALGGLRLAGARLLRCRPGGGGGHDPVPQRPPRPPHRHGGPDAGTMPGDAG